MWDVESSEEYDEWFSGLDDSSKESVYERILLLREFGPNLPRPYADVLHGSKKLSNLKELGNRTRQSFYKDLISAAESIVERDEKELEDKK